MPTAPWLQTLGWMAAALAVIGLRAAMGVAAGTSQYFLGPMAAASHGGDDGGVCGIGGAESVQERV